MCEDVPRGIFKAQNAMLSRECHHRSVFATLVRSERSEFSRHLSHAPEIQLFLAGIWPEPRVYLETLEVSDSSLALNSHRCVYSQIREHMCPLVHRRGSILRDASVRYFGSTQNRTLSTAEAAYFHALASRLHDKQEITKIYESTLRGP